MLLKKKSSTCSTVHHAFKKGVTFKKKKKDNIFTDICIFNLYTKIRALLKNLINIIVSCQYTVI